MNFWIPDPFVGRRIYCKVLVSTSRQAMILSSCNSTPELFCGSQSGLTSGRMVIINAVRLEEILHQLTEQIFSMRLLQQDSVPFNFGITCSSDFWILSVLLAISLINISSNLNLYMILWYIYIFMLWHSLHEIKVTHLYTNDLMYICASYADMDTPRWKLWHNSQLRFFSPSALGLSSVLSSEEFRRWTTPGQGGNVDT